MLEYRVALSGYLEISRYPQFRAELDRAPEGRPVLIDLRQATGVDAVFLSELLRFARSRSAAVAVVIVPGGPLAHVFSVLNVGDAIAVFTDFTQAIEALNAVP